MGLFERELREALGEETIEEAQARRDKEYEKRAKRWEWQKRWMWVKEYSPEIVLIVSRIALWILVVYSIHIVENRVRDYFHAHPTDIHIHIGGNEK